MMRNRMLNMSERWFRLLQRLYPPDFRDDMSNAVVEAYMDRARDVLKSGGRIRLVALWVRALVDSMHNGPAERARPAASWRRAGNWGRDIELVRRRIVRSPIFAATTIGTLTIGLGMFAVVYTAVQKILIDPMPYKDPGDLYYVWRDYGPIADLKRGALAGTDIAERPKTNAVIEGAAGRRCLATGARKVPPKQSFAGLFRKNGVLMNGWLPAAHSGYCRQSSRETAVSTRIAHWFKVSTLAFVRRSTAHAGRAPNFAVSKWVKISAAPRFSPLCSPLCSPFFSPFSMIH